MQDTSCTIIIEISAGWRIFIETPVSIVGTRNNGFSTWYCVKQCTSISAVSIGICAGDLGRCSFDVLDIVVDGADEGLFSRGLEPGGKEISGSTSGSVCVGGQCDGIRNSGCEGGGLSAGAAAEGYDTLLNARHEGWFISGDEVA